MLVCNFVVVAMLLLLLLFIDVTVENLGKFKLPMLIFPSLVFAIISVN